MSNRTLIEFNHDRWFKVQSDKDGFVEAILEMLRAGGTPYVVDRLDDFGITYVSQRHHSDPVSVVYKHHKIEL